MNLRLNCCCNDQGRRQPKFDSFVWLEMTSIEIDLDYFRTKLKELARQINSLAQQVDGAARPVELDQTRVGRLSRMDAMQGQAIAQASVTRRQAQTQALKKALARIVAGNFGRCLECDEFIALARLDIDPTVELCIELRAEF